MSTEEDTKSDYYESCISDATSTLHPPFHEPSDQPDDSVDKMSWQPPEDWLIEDGINLHELGIAI